MSGEERQDAVETGKKGYWRELTLEEVRERKEERARKAREDRLDDENEQLIENAIGIMADRGLLYPEALALLEESEAAVLRTSKAEVGGWMWYIRVNTPTEENEHAWTEYRVIALNLTLALESLTWALNRPVSEEVVNVLKGSWYDPVMIVSKVDKYDNSK